MNLNTILIVMVILIVTKLGQKEAVGFLSPEPVGEVSVDAD